MAAPRHCVSPYSASQPAPFLKWRPQAARVLNMVPSVLTWSQNGCPCPRQLAIHSYPPRGLEADVPTTIRLKVHGRLQPRIMGQGDPSKHGVAGSGRVDLARQSRFLQLAEQIPFGVETEECRQCRAPFLGRLLVSQELDKPDSWVSWGTGARPAISPSGPFCHTRRKRSPPPVCLPPQVMVQRRACPEARPKPQSPPSPPDSNLAGL